MKNLSALALSLCLIFCASIACNCQSSFKPDLPIAQATQSKSTPSDAPDNAEQETTSDTVNSGEESLEIGPKYEIVKFKSGNLTLCGALWKPDGKGPFPAVVYNHGSEQQNGLGKMYGGVGRFYASHGFVCLLPLRRGHSFVYHGQTLCTSEGVYFSQRQKQAAPAGTPAHQWNMSWLQQQDIDNDDVVAAVNWLETQPFVDPKLVIMSGISFGGIQTCLAAQRELPIRAFIPFAPGAMSWVQIPELHDRLKQALEKANAPVFLLQAQNDYNLGPSQYLGPVLDQKGPPNRHKIYPPFAVEEGHKGGHGGFACRGMSIWSPDVFAFLKDVLGTQLKISQVPAAAKP